MAVERAFGLLVGRWGLLWRPLKVKGRNRAVMLDAIVRLHNLCVDETVDWSMREEQQVREAAGLVRTADGRWMERDNVTKLAGTEVPCNAHAEAARRGNDGATDASCGTGPASAPARAIHRGRGTPRGHPRGVGAGGQDPPAYRLVISRAYRWLMDEGALLDGRALDHWRKEQVAAEFRQYTQQKATLPYILTPPTTESEFRHRP